MIIVRLKGGMGNQMFQYALGRALSIKYNVPLKLDIELYKLKNHLTKRNYDLDVFNVACEIATKKDIPILKRNFGNGKILYQANEFMRNLFGAKGKERSFSYDPGILSIGGDAYLDGYWQSPKYFDDIQNVIRKDFTLKNPPSSDIKNLMEEIKNKNSLCIHVRRGDYVGNPIYEVVGTEYYGKEVEAISKNATIDKIYVFSDDIEWCKKNLTFQFPTMFVGEEYAGQKAEGNILLMSVCKYFIIPNSSFSWWGAWLSERDGKIVMVPKKWFNNKTHTSDLIPENWIQL